MRTPAPIQPAPGRLFGRPFRFAPQNVYGRPDWDLILRGFVDVGQSLISDRFAFEREETLVGAGIGAELLFKRRFNIRVDWGFALEPTASGNVNAGSNRVYFRATWFF